MTAPACGQLASWYAPACQQAASWCIHHCSQLADDRQSGQLRLLTSLPIVGKLAIDKCFLLADYRQAGSHFKQVRIFCTPACQ
jgi:hypothetical protein